MLTFIHQCIAYKDIAAQLQTSRQTSFSPVFSPFVCPAFDAVDLSSASLSHTSVTLAPNKYSMTSHYVRLIPRPLLALKSGPGGVENPAYCPLVLRRMVSTDLPHETLLPKGARGKGSDKSRRGHRGLINMHGPFGEAAIFLNDSVPRRNSTGGGATGNKRVCLLGRVCVPVLAFCSEPNQRLCLR